MILLALLLSLLQSAAASVEGVVVRAGSNEPVANARVMLVKSGLSQVELLAGASSIPPVQTDREGRFVFKSVEPGLYRILLEANGYVRQEYGQRSFPGIGTPVPLSGGEAKKDIVVRLTPTGTVAGRILNGEGRPQVAVPVRLLKYVYDSEGNRTLKQFAVTQTDDRGEYRMFFVTPGHYYVNAGTAQGTGGYGEGRVGPNEIRQTYAYQYYPGVADLNAATPVEVRPGETLTAIDLKLAKQLRYSVRGRVVDAVTDRPPEKPILYLHFHDVGTGATYSVENDPRDFEKGLTYRDGMFEFRGVVPGDYYLSASETINTPNRQSRRTGILPVQVAASDVDGILVTIPAGFSISGRVRVEGGETLARASVSPSVRLRRAATNSGTSSILDVGAAVASDGTFQILDATPGAYRIAMWLTPRFYIKDARYGLTDILNSEFEVTGRESQNLEIVLSPNSATLEGIVTNSRGEPAGGAQVVVVPNRFRDRTELFKSASADQNGRFTVSGIPPGDYKVFAWESIEPYSWFDPEILKRDEQAGKAIRFEESSRMRLDLRVIPTR
jgi:hypothetical protein